MLTPDEKIKLFLSLFKGRPEIFAKRWESRDGLKSGYSPVCQNEWKRGICTKAQGQPCQNCVYTALTQEHVRQHLQGELVVGIYPMLADNTSHFLVADFDQTSWQEDATKFIAQCEHYHIPAYLERSRSGNGGHVWLFFSEPYPAAQSRLLGFRLLKAAGLVNQFDPLDSFDRFIPNQDMLRRGAIGNLIALPLQHQARQHGNTVFLDTNKDYQPYEDQWTFLQQVETSTPEQLDSVLADFMDKKGTGSSQSQKVEITINNYLSIPRASVTSLLQEFLTKQLNFLNAQYLVLKRMNRSTYGIEKYFRLIEADDEHIFLPRGFLQALTTFCDQHDISYNIQNQRHTCDKVSFHSSYTLRTYQLLAIEALAQHNEGIVVAPPGAGKTVIGLEVIARQQQPALVIVHTKQIMDQWVQRIEDMFGIAKPEIGQLSGAKKKVGKLITVAMIQTLSRMESLEKYKEQFGTIVVDECHHMPAQMFRKVIPQFNPYYLYGLTATPERKFNDAALIETYLGEIVSTIDQLAMQDNANPTTSSQLIDLHILETAVQLPFAIRTTNLALGYKALLFDTQRNQQIVSDIIQLAGQHKKCLVMTERKDHVELLRYYLGNNHEVITLTGDLTKTQRTMRLKQIQTGDFDIVVATGQLLGEGTDIPSFDALFLVYPFSSAVKLKQYIGRIQRGKETVRSVYDYRDRQIDFFDRMYKKRKQVYTKYFGVQPE
ncbi:MAG: DEAD/DEAH box helicase family protein [Candidatus Kerfeldbacteria bacterium]|nr:DEAD/DEAH box helicase family protein [Candidatus Kerfeldbacteria bacterium]